MGLVPGLGTPDATGRPEMGKEKKSAPREESGSWIDQKGERKSDRREKLDSFIQTFAEHLLCATHYAKQEIQL